MGVLMQTRAQATFELDIDQTNTSLYTIWIGDKYYSCTPKTPPLSHSWSYECVGSQRMLRSQT